MLQTAAKIIKTSLYRLNSSKKRYCFNEQDLRFEEVSSNPGKKLIKSLVFVFIFSFIALILLITTGLFFGSPEEHYLQSRAETLINSLEELDNEAVRCRHELTHRHYEQDNYYRVILGLDSLPMTMRFAGTGGSEDNHRYGFYDNPEVVLQVTQRVTTLKNQLKIQHDSYDILLENAGLYHEKLARMPGIMPIFPGDPYWITSYFGFRQDPFTNGRRMHYGIDFAARQGTKIYATGDGIVTLSKHSRKGYGNEIVIDHGFGFSTRYGHFKEIKVVEGEKVKRGQLIGYMGSSGRSTGTHLHYEVRYYNKPVNPEYYYSDDITEEEYKQIIKLNN